MKVKIKKHKKSPAPREPEQVKTIPKEIEYVSIDLKKMIENAKTTLHKSV